MAFDAGAVIGEAILDTAKWSSGVGVVSKLSKSLGGILKKGLAVGFAGVSAGMAASIVQANSYQKEFKNVATLTNQNTEALQDMSLGLLSLDSDLGTTRELTKSMYDAISAGAKPGAEALETVASSAKFAKAALADNAASVKLLSATQNAYGRDTITANKAADVFFTTIKKGVITGEELAGSIGQSIPLFASMNIPVEQLASGMAAMTKQGVSASESTTQLNAIVSAFLKPSEALTEELKKQGFESGEAFIKAKGLTGALDLLKNSTGEGGKEIAELLPNIRAMRGAMALSGQGAIEYADTLEAMESSAGAVDKAFKKQEKTFATFKAELGKTSIIVGNIGKFFVDDIAGGAQQALESINQFLTSGEGLETFSDIAEKIGGSFNVLKVFAEQVFNLFKDDLFAVIQDVTNEFNELFKGTMDQGDAFNFIAQAADLLGAALNVVASLARLVVTNFLHLINIGLKVADVIGNLWDVVTGKKSLSETEEAFKAVGEAVVNLGKNFIEQGSKVVTEVREQWAEMGKEQGVNAAVFSKSWEEGSKKASDFVRKNFKAAVSGVKEGSGEIEEESTTTAAVVQDNEVETTAVIEAEIEKRKGFYNGWAEFAAQNLSTTFDAFMFWADQVSNLVGTLFDGIGEVSELHYENELDKIELKTQAELEALNNAASLEQMALVQQLNNGIITEEEFNNISDANDKKHALAKDTIEKDAAKKSNDIAKKQFDTQKALSIGQIWIDAARATLGFWSWAAPLGPPGWAIAATMTTATAGIAIGETKEVAKQQFVPAFAGGTNSAPGGMALVGEEGPELKVIERGAKIIPAGLTRDLLSGGGQSQNIININDPIVREPQDLNRIAKIVDDKLSKRLKFA